MLVTASIEGAIVVARASSYRTPRPARSYRPDLVGRLPRPGSSCTVPVPSHCRQSSTLTRCSRRRASPRLRCGVPTWSPPGRRRAARRRRIRRRPTPSRLPVVRWRLSWSLRLLRSLVRQTVTRGCRAAGPRRSRAGPGRRWCVPRSAWSGRPGRSSHRVVRGRPDSPGNTPYGRAPVAPRSGGIGFRGAVPNQRHHRRGGAGGRVNGFDAHGVGHLLRVRVPAEVEFGWDAGGFEVGVSCHRVPIPAGSTTFTRPVDL